MGVQEVESTKPGNWLDLGHEEETGVKDDTHIPGLTTGEAATH